MTYSPWAELSALPALTLRWEPLRPGRLGEYVHALRLIRLDPRLPRHQARCVLAHELRHHHHGDTWPATTWQEKRADREAARLLVDIRELADAAVLHDQHMAAVARELRVTVVVVRNRLEHLHPSERGHLRARLDDTTHDLGTTP